MKRPRNILMKAKRLIFTLLILLMTAAAASGFIVLYLLKPVSINSEAETQKIVISRGLSAKSIGVMLYEKKLIRSPLLFYAAARYSGTVIKAGVYQISPDMQYMEILKLLEKGKDAQIIVSIPEGLTISRIGSLLEQKGVASAADFISASRDPLILEKYAIPSESAEGYLFPDTYYLQPDMSPSQAVSIMIENFFTKVKSIPALEDKTNTELFYVVRLASIVEREYRRADEAPLIASVFANRLRYNIGLYSCATIVYIVTEIEGRDHPERITEKDTRIESPYNTYLYAGLPPSPISNPGLTALKAAADPPRTEYYYFRLIDETSGTHTFTKNFDDHKEAGLTLTAKKRAGN